MRTVGTGKGLAVLFNARAKRFTPLRVRALRAAVPDALVLVSEDLRQARRHAALLATEKPDVVLGAGGDGSMVQLMNLLREAGRDAWFPAIGALKLGTGNALANTTSAPEYFNLVSRLSSARWPLPTRRFDMLEVEGCLCHFAGVGWDARIINDYLRNLDRRSSQLIGSRASTRLHKGLGGYLYTLFRITVPEEAKLLREFGQARVSLTTRDEQVWGLDASARPVLLPGPAPGTNTVRTLFEGPVSVGSAATAPEWGFRFKAFPYAQAKPGTANIRVYDRPVLEAVRNAPRLWRGAFPQPGMHDWFVTQATMRFSRPMPFQIGGDGLGTRERVDYARAPRPIEVVDWNNAWE